MADTKISALTVATTPLAGTEVLPIVQSGVTKQVSVADLTAGRAVSALSMTLTNALAVTSGGTGLSTVAQGDLLYGSASNTLSALTKNTTASRYLSNSGTSNNPAWAQVDLTNGVTGTLPVGNGGTGTATAFTAGSVVFAGASGVYSQNNANFFWDNTNNRLGLGLTNPSYPLEIGMTNSISLAWQRTGVSAKKWGFQSDNSATYLANVTDNTLVTSFFNTGGVSIGNTTDPGANNLSVTGTISSGSRAITKASMPTGSILQVVQTSTTSIFVSTTSATFAGTGLSASITPTASSSKILVLVMANFNGSGYQTQATIYRGATNLAGANGMLLLNNSGAWLPLHMSYLDSPSTTSSTTYEVYWRTTTGGTSYFGGDGNQTITITLLEVAA